MNKKYVGIALILFSILLFSAALSVVVDTLNEYRGIGLIGTFLSYIVFAGISFKIFKRGLKKLDNEEG